MTKSTIIVVALLLLVSICLGQTVVYGGTVTQVDWDSATLNFINPTGSLDSVCGHLCESGGDLACLASGNIALSVAYSTVNDGTKTYYVINSPGVAVVLPAGVADLTFGVHVVRGVLGGYNTVDIGLNGPVGFIVSETFFAGPSTFAINIYNGSVLLPGGGLPMYEGSAGYTLYARIPASTAPRSFYISPAFNSLAALQSNINPETIYDVTTDAATFYIVGVPGSITECASDPSPETAPPTPAPSTEAPPTTEAPTTTPPPTTTVCVPQQCSLATCGQLIQDGCGSSIQCPVCPVGQCSFSGNNVICNALSTGQALAINTTQSTTIAVLSISFSVTNDPSMGISMLYSVNGSQRTTSGKVSLTNAKYLESFQALLNGSSDEISFLFPIVVSGLNTTVIVNLTLDNVVLALQKRQSSNTVGSADILIGLCFANLPGKSGLAHGNHDKNGNGLANRHIDAVCKTSEIIAYNAAIGLSASSVNALISSIENSSSTVTMAAAVVAFAALASLF